MHLPFGIRISCPFDQLQNPELLILFCENTFVEDVMLKIQQVVAQLFVAEHHFLL
jgi:hypothetical protein